MTRLEANKLIIQTILEYATNYPDLRFGQILTNLNIATHLQTYGTPLQEYSYTDIFFDESVKTLKMLNYFKPNSDMTTNAPVLLQVEGWSTNQLVDFGNYVLSEYRTNLINSHPDTDTASKEMALISVSDADVANFKATIQD